MMNSCIRNWESFITAWKYEAIISTEYINYLVFRGR